MIKTQKWTSLFHVQIAHQIRTYQQSIIILLLHYYNWACSNYYFYFIIRSLDSHSTSLEGIVQIDEIPSCLYSDSDNEFDLVVWASNVSTEILDQLSSKEKKRQEIINELYHTERSHIRGNHT